MHKLSVIGTQWLGRMGRNYFDISQLRVGMDLTNKTLEALGNGAISSSAAQDALINYGRVYAEGMLKLYEGYKSLENSNKIQEGMDKFQKVLDSVEKSLTLDGILEEPKRELTYSRK